MKSEGQQSSPKAQRTFQAVTRPCWKSVMCPIGPARGFFLARFSCLGKVGILQRDMRERESRERERGQKWWGESPNTGEVEKLLLLRVHLRVSGWSSEAQSISREVKGTVRPEPMSLAEAAPGLPGEDKCARGEASRK